MDDGRRKVVVSEDGERVDGADQTNLSSSKHLQDEIPEGRRAAGRFIKSLALEKQLTVTAFLHDKDLGKHKGKFDKLIQGRKIIREPEAAFLVDLFGGTIDFWMTLEHKILENPSISVPSSDPPNRFRGSDRRFMSDTSNEFRAVNGSDEALSGRFIVLGEGKDRMLIPKDLPPEVISNLCKEWLTCNKAVPSTAADLTVDR